MASKLTKESWEPEKKFSWIGSDIYTQTGFIFASAVRMKKLLNDPNEVCSVLEASAFVHVKRIASIVGQLFRCLQAVETLQKS